MTYTILGIDAAWTKKQPSGCAVITKDTDGWVCKGLAPSYSSFISLADNRPVNWSERPTGAAPDITAIVRAAEVLSNSQIDLVAIDMPLASESITQRRAADDAISKRYGAKGCSTHSPTIERPGTIAESIYRGLIDLNFRHVTSHPAHDDRKIFIEMYPHPALVTLMNADYRIPYKVSKSTRYWPNTCAKDRKTKLLESFAEIVEKLNLDISNIDLLLPASEAVKSLNYLKRYEDALDALVCCWVGTRYFDDRAEPFGDNHSAIWCPV
jgi:predicted RNase H-like nuclease